MAEGERHEDKHEGVLTIPHDEPAQQPAVVVSSDQPAPEAEAPAAQGETEPQGGFFHQDLNDEPAPAPDAPDSVSWTASEFIAHDKSASWYLGLAVAAAILAFFVYVITRDFVSVAVVVAAGVIFGIYAAHRPRQLEYKLDHQGLTVGNKRYAFSQFRSYSVVPEGGISSITFMPLKRFGAPLSIYYPHEEEKKIMAVLGGSLPYEEPRRDTVDSLVKKIRF